MSPHKQVFDKDYSNWSFKRGSSNTSYFRCMFSQVNASGTIWENVAFVSCNFRLSDFAMAKFIGCQFVQCWFFKVNWVGVKLQDTPLDWNNPEMLGWVLDNHVGFFVNNERAALVDNLCRSLSVVEGFENYYTQDTINWLYSTLRGYVLPSDETNTDNKLLLKVLAHGV